MNEQEVLAALGRPGWTVVSRNDVTKSVDEVDSEGFLTGRKITKPTGAVVWVISDGKGHNDTMTVQARWSDNGRPTGGGYSYEVVKPPTKAAPATGGGGATATQRGAASASVPLLPRTVDKATLESHYAASERVMGDTNASAEEKAAARREAEWAAGQLQTISSEASKPKGEPGTYIVDQFGVPYAIWTPEGKPKDLTEKEQKAALDAINAQRAKDGQPALSAATVGAATAGGGRAGGGGGGGRPMTAAQALAAERGTTLSPGQKIVHPVTGEVIYEAEKADTIREVAGYGVVAVHPDNSFTVIIPEKNPAQPDVAAPATPYVQRFNAKTGEYEIVPNEGYEEPLSQDAATRIAQMQERASKVRDRLIEDVRLGRIKAEGGKTAEQIAQERFDAYWQTHIETPLGQLRQTEERQRYKDLADYSELERRSSVDEANFNQQRQTAGQAAGRDAVERTLALLPYKVGPSFGKAMSNLANAFATGTAGVDIPLDAVTFDAPDLDAIAEAATQRAIGRYGAFRNTLPPPPPTFTSTVPTTTRPALFAPVATAPAETTAPPAPAAVESIEDPRVLDVLNNTRYMLRR